MILVFEWRKLLVNNFSATICTCFVNQIRYNLHNKLHRYSIKNCFIVVALNETVFQNYFNVHLGN